MERLPESTRLLYVQLLSECAQSAAPGRRGLSFVSKRIRGGLHWYMQLTVGSAKTQHYLGPDSEELGQAIAREKALWERAAPDVDHRQKLVSMLISGGAYTVGSVEARVLELLERAGVFLTGGVLVGSHAFAIYGNMLGVKWEREAARTQDVDIARDYRIGIGITDRRINLKQSLAESDMGFFEVPALDRKSPSTKFKIRGQQLSVDVLTPMLGKTSSKPVHLTALDAYAEPVRFLDYVLENSQPAVVVARAGMLVNVPTPARYALHKLVTAQRRIAAMHSKTLKDIRQAELLLSVLLEDRPGDVARAWHAALKQPPKFRTQIRAGMQKLPAEMRARLKKLTGR